MFKLAKFMYELGYKNARKDILNKLEYAISTEYRNAENADLRKFIDDKKDKNLIYVDKPDPKEHGYKAKGFEMFKKWVFPEVDDVGNDLVATDKDASND